jgi:hypothetical protein
MADSVIARVEIRPPAGEAALAASHKSADLTEEDLARITNVVNQSVTVIQQGISLPSPSTDHPMRFSEIEMKFGLSLEGEAKVPIIGPLLGIGIKAGATFEITVKFSRG